VRLAIILIAIGIAMAAAPIIAIDDRGIVRLAIAASLFPLLVGGALWLRFVAAQRAKRRAGEE
jgi:membrane associated rhomboid family serine protease